MKTGIYRPQRVVEVLEGIEARDGIKRSNLAAALVASRITAEGLHGLLAGALGTEEGQLPMAVLLLGSASLLRTLDDAIACVDMDVEMGALMRAMRSDHADAVASMTASMQTTRPHDDGHEGSTAD